MAVHARLGFTSEHYAPARYVDAARETMGGCIDLDPASSAIANATVQATRFFTREDDGLTRPWGAAEQPVRVFLNPPYSDYRGQAAHWADKLAHEYDSGHVAQAVMLVNATALYQAAFQQLVWRAALCFPDHRIRFIDAQTGQPQDKPPQPSVFLYLGRHRDAFHRCFHKFGATMIGYLV